MEAAKTGIQDTNMASLLEKQYKRGERARKKNKQEERKMVHEISGKGGLKALHEYRVEMVTREQRKIAEELERLRDGLRLYRGQRPKAGARHREAKRGLHNHAVSSPRLEPTMSQFSSAKPVMHRQQFGKSRSSYEKSPENDHDLPRLAKSGQFLTARVGDSLAQQRRNLQGATPLSSRSENKHIGKARITEKYARERGVVSSRSTDDRIAVTNGVAGNDSDDSSDFDSDDDYSRGVSLTPGGSKRPPDPEILRAILKGVVQCWEKTVVAATELSEGGQRTLAGYDSGVVTAACTPTADIFSPRQPREVSRKASITHNAGEGTALSAALFRNMKANKVDVKNLVSIKSAAEKKKTLDTSIPFDKSLQTDTAVPTDQQPTNAGSQRFLSQSESTRNNLDMVNCRGDSTSEGTHQHVAKDSSLKNKEDHYNKSSLYEKLTQTKKTASETSVQYYEETDAQSAQSVPSLQLNDNASDGEAASPRSFGRHVRTINKEQRKSGSRSKQSSANSSTRGSVIQEKSGDKKCDKISLRQINTSEPLAIDEREDEGDVSPRVSFRLPPLKKSQAAPPSKRVASKSGPPQGISRDPKLKEGEANGHNYSAKRHNALPPLPSISPTHHAEKVVGESSRHSMSAREQTKRKKEHSMTALERNADVTAQRLVYHNQSNMTTDTNIQNHEEEEGDNSSPMNSARKQRNSAAGPFKKKLHVHHGSPQRSPR